MGDLVKDANLAQIKDLTSLQTLDLLTAQVTNAGMVYLKGLTTLRELDLSMTRVSDAGLMQLKGHAGLQKLWLANTRCVTDAGVAELQKALPACRIERTKYSAWK